MEMPHATHKQVTFGWLQMLLEFLAARRDRRRTAVLSLELENLRPAQRGAGLFNPAAPH
jgi:hypothetical protein